MRDIHWLVAFVTLAHSSMAASRVAVPLYALHLHASPAVVGILVGLFAVPPTLVSVAVGRLIDRVGTRTPLVAFTLVMMAGMVLPFLWQDALLPLYLVGLLVGGGYFALFIVHNSLTGYYGKPEERSSNFAQASLAFSAANGLGPLLAGFMIDHAGHAWTFLLLTLLSAAAFSIYLAGKLPQRGPQPAPARAMRQGSVIGLLRDPRMGPIYVISIYFMLLWGIFMALTPIYGAELKLSASVIGIIIFTFFAAGFVVRLFVRALARRFSPMQLLLLSQAVGAIAMLLFGFASAAGLLIVIAFAIGVGQGVGGPMINTALYDMSPPDRLNEAAGLRVSVGTACQAVLPLLAGASASLVGVAPLFWITAAVLMHGVWHYRGQWQVDLDSVIDKARTRRSNEPS